MIEIVTPQQLGFVTRFLNWSPPAKNHEAKSGTGCCLVGDHAQEAVDCVREDKEELFAFYDFPATHWVHIRTTNPIESTYATVRLRTKKTKGCGSRMATLTMVFKLALEAEKTWRRLTGHKLMELVMQGRRFVDGELQEVAA